MAEHTLKVALSDDQEIAVAAELEKINSGVVEKDVVATLEGFLLGRIENIVEGLVQGFISDAMTTDPTKKTAMMAAAAA